MGIVGLYCLVLIQSPSPLGHGVSSLAVWDGVEKDGIDWSVAFHHWDLKTSLALGFLVVLCTATNSALSLVPQCALVQGSSDPSKLRARETNNSRPSSGHECTKAFYKGASKGQRSSVKSKTWKPKNSEIRWSWCWSLRAFETRFSIQAVKPCVAGLNCQDLLHHSLKMKSILRVCQVVKSDVMYWYTWKLSANRNFNILEPAKSS